MIAAFIFLIHICGAVYAFLEYKKEGTSEGWLAVAFVVIIFSVGWTITTMVAKVLFPTTLAAEWVSRLQATHIERLVAKELTVDTLSLVLLTVGEIIFYSIYLGSGKNGKRPDMKNDQV